MRTIRRTILLLLCGMFLTGCAPVASMAEPTATAPPVYERYSTNFFDTFDTLISLIAYAPDEAAFQTAAGEAHALFQRLHQLYDGYNAYEGVHNLYTLNQEAAKGPVEVPPELMDLLLFCQKNQPVTEGTTNVALGAVLFIWHEYREDGLADEASAQLPPMDALLAASAHTRMEDVVLDAEKRTVYYADTALKLDLGAVAKGYAAEIVAQHLLASNVSHFVLSAGGNVRIGNPPLDGKRKNWGIGIQDPNSSVFSTDTSSTVESFYLSNMSVVTSGTYQRYYVVDGQAYHHLIDPSTLMPGTYYQAVTIITEDSGMADLLSTAAFLLPYARSRALIDSLEGVEALWILPDGTIEMTDGARQAAKSGGATATQ